MPDEQASIADENLDLAILRVLDRNAGTRYGLGRRAVAMLVNEFGFAPDLEVVDRRFDYLSDAEIGYVAEHNKGLFHAANRTWRITAKGVNYLRGRGF